LTASGFWLGFESAHAWDPAALQLDVLALEIDPAESNGHNFG
jgi:hypothetical protein